MVRHRLGDWLDEEEDRRKDANKDDSGGDKVVISQITPVEICSREEDKNRNTEGRGGGWPGSESCAIVNSLFWSHG